MHACRRQDVAGRGGCFCISVASPQLQSLIACTVRVRLRRPNKSGGTRTPRGCTRARDKPVRTHALRCTAAAHRSAAPSGRWASACSAQQSAATSHQAAACSVSPGRPNGRPRRPAAEPCASASHATRSPRTRCKIPGQSDTSAAYATHAFPNPWGKNMGDLTSPSSHTFACVRVVKCMSY